MTKMTNNTGTQSQNYFNVKALSKSILSVYEDDFPAFVNYWVYNRPLPKKRDDSLSLGTAVDLILNPNIDESQAIHVFKGEVPTAQALIYITNLTRNNCNFDEAYESLKIKNGGKLQKSPDQFKEVFEKYQPYYESLIESVKPVLTEELFLYSKEVAASAKINRFTAPLVNVETDTNAGIEVLYQLEIYEEYLGILLKGALDKVIIDHKKKRIVPLDFKTTYNSLGFPYEVIKYKYGRQGSIYKHLLTIWAEKNGYGDYFIASFYFVALSTTNLKTHLLYKLKDSDSEILAEGGYNKYGNSIKGWKNLISEIKYLEDNNIWDYPYDIINAKGIMELDLFGTNNLDNNESTES